MYDVEMPTFPSDAENHCSENTRNSSCHVTVFDVVVVGSDKHTDVQTNKRTNLQTYKHKNVHTHTNKRTDIQTHKHTDICTISMHWYDNMFEQS